MCHLLACFSVWNKLKHLLNISWASPSFEVDILSAGHRQKSFPKLSSFSFLTIRKQHRSGQSISSGDNLWYWTTVPISGLQIAAEFPPKSFEWRWAIARSLINVSTLATVRELGNFFIEILYFSAKVQESHLKWFELENVHSLIHSVQKEFARVVWTCGPFSDHIRID